MWDSLWFTKVINNSGYQFTTLKVNYVAKQSQKIEICAEFKVCSQTLYWCILMYIKPNHIKQHFKLDQICAVLTLVNESKFVYKLHILYFVNVW